MSVWSALLLALAGMVGAVVAPLRRHPSIRMFLLLGLPLLWLLGFSFHVGGSLIHILLVLAVIALLFNLITGRRTVV